MHLQLSPGQRADAADAKGVDEQLRRLRHAPTTVMAGVTSVAGPQKHREDCRRHQSWLTARAASDKTVRPGQLTSASGASKTSTATAEVPHRLLFKAPSCKIPASERCCLQTTFYHCADALQGKKAVPPKRQIL